MKIQRLFYTLLNKGDKETGFFRRGKKFFLSPFLKCITKLKCQQQQNLVFSLMYLVSVYPKERTLIAYFCFSARVKTLILNGLWTNRIDAKVVNALMP